MKAMFGIVLLGCFLSAGQAFATAYSCQGEGDLKDIYISISASRFTRATHVCIGDKEEHLTDRRVVVDDQIRRDDPEYRWERLTTKFYQERAGGRLIVLPETISKINFRVRVMDKDAYEEILKEVEEVPAFERSSKFLSLANPQVSTFTCRSLPTDDYFAPCDLQNASGVVKDIASGRFAPMTTEAVVDHIGVYIRKLVEGNGSPEELDKLIEKANRSK